MGNDKLIFDWNGKDQKIGMVELFDETLRDGLQSPSVKDPKAEHKLELLSLMSSLGIAMADIGLPGAGPKAYDDCLTLAKYARDEKLKIEIACAGRTLKGDIKPIAEIQQQAGIPVFAYLFLGTSPIRQMVEDWDLDILKKTTEDALVFAQKENLSVAFTTEDTTRSHPDTLRVLFNHAIDLGAKRLVLCDTVGHATPTGIKALVDFTKEIIKQSKKTVKIDWHGHNDRGLAVANSLSAAEFGCHRIHATALGIGERVGNTSMDQLMVNLKLLGLDLDLRLLNQYVLKASAYTEVSIPHNYPVFGSDAFRTATGVHAAAVIKALAQNDKTLADIIYSGVPAFWFGKKQKIEVGPMSGASNVKYCLMEMGIGPKDELIKKILHYAKKQSSILSTEDLKRLVKADDK